MVVEPFVLPPPSKVFITNDSKRAGTSENRSSFSLLYIGVQLKWGGGVTNGHGAICTPPSLPLYFITNH